MKRPTTMLHTIGQHIKTRRTFAHANDAVIAIKFALMVPVLLLTIGIAIDASALTSQKSDLQGAADIGSIAGAKELSFSDFDKDNVSAVVEDVVKRFVQAQDVAFDDGALTVDTKVTESPLRVTVNVQRNATSFFKKFIGHNIDKLSASSSAEIIG